MQSWQRLSAAAICGACLILALVIPVAAAPTLSIQATRQDPSGTIVFAPTITDRQGVLQPPLALPGQYVIATGSGFPANTPITASLNDGTKTIPLMYQDLPPTGATPQQPVTDAMGGINSAAFQIPPAAQIGSKRCTFAVSVGGVVTAALVDVDLPDPTATSGDKLVIGAAGVFYLVMGIVFFVLLRGLPTYPVQRVPRGAQRSRSDAAA